MVLHQLLEDQSILVVQPKGALDAEDFSGIAAAVDPFIEQRGGLRGLLIEAESFPGWRDFAGLVSHLRFVRNHHKHIKRVAAVTDSAFAAIAPSVANHFTAAEVRHFPFAEREAAMAWLLED